MQPCDDRLVDLIDLAEGAVDAARRDSVELHAAACEGCREELAGMRAVGLELRATSVVVDHLHLSGFARRTADAAVTFRDRSARGLFWSLTRGVRLALGGSLASLAVALALFVGARHAAPEVTQAPEIVAETAAGTADDDSALASLASTDDDLAEASVSLDSAFDSLSADELDLLDEQLDDDAT